MVKKVVTTVGQYKDYIDEMQQSYVLGFTPYRLHTNGDGTFVTPIRTYDGQVYVLDDVATMKVTVWYIASDTISSKQVVKGDVGGGDMVTLHGDRAPLGAKGLDEIPVIMGPLEVEVQLESAILQDPKVFLKNW